MMTDSPHLEIKVQGCWSVRNLAFGSDDKLKGQIMEVRESEASQLCPTPTIK
jgi:hypothetical protein